MLIFCFKEMNGWFDIFHFSILKNWKKVNCVLFHNNQHFRNGR